jgi:predicted NACHT family NTPase
VGREGAGKEKLSVTSCSDPIRAYLEFWAAGELGHQFLVAQPSDSLEPHNVQKPLKGSTRRACS